MSGSAWNNVKSIADASLGTPNLADQDTTHNVRTMAAALVYAKTGDTSYREKTADAIISAIGTENNPDPDCGNSSGGARSLALGRNLAAYVIAADLIDLKSYDAVKNQQFQTWLQGIIRRINCEGRTIISCHEERPNNWGTMCGASRIAVDIYIGDKTDLNRAANVFHGYVGDISAYNGFTFGSVADWACTPYRGLNPVGCTKEGQDVSGAPVDDVRRGGGFQWPPAPTNYAWGGFSAAAAQAEMLYRAGYPAYEWENQAIKRGMQFIATNMASSQSAPTEWLFWLVNFHYGTNFPAKTPISIGRLVGWTDWTHVQ